MCYHAYRFRYNGTKFLRLSGHPNQYRYKEYWIKQNHGHKGQGTLYAKNNRDPAAYPFVLFGGYHCL